MSAERTCENCHAPLDGRRPEARYCSPACRRAAATDCRLLARVMRDALREKVDG